MMRLKTTGHHTRLDQVHNSVGNDVTMDAEVASIPKVPQRLIWDATQSDLQGLAIVDDRR